MKIRGDSGQAEEPAPPTGRAQTRIAAAVALAAFTVIAIGLFANTLFSACTRCLMGLGEDPPQFIWFLGWVPVALSRGLNPIMTDLMHYPRGANLMFSTSMLLPSLALSPLTAAWGPIISYRVLSTASLALSAWTAYLMIGRYVMGRLPAVVGGLVYGFSPYMIAHALGHPNLTFAVYPPLAVIFLDEIVVRRRYSSRLLGAGLGAASAAQLLIGAEVLVSTVLMLGLGLAVLAVLHRSIVSQTLRSSAGAAVAAALTFLILAAVPLWYALFGPQRLEGRFIARNVFVNDLQSFVVPTRLQALSPAGAEQISRSWTGNLAEWNGYIGVPLLALLAVAARRFWRLRAMRLGTAAAGSAVLLSMGPFLHIAGRSLPVPLPWVIPSLTPVIQNIPASRIMLFGYLAIGLMVAVFLDQFRGQGRAALGAAAVTALALAPWFPALPFPKTSPAAPSIFTAGALDRLPQGTVAVVTPYGSPSSETMFWQALAGYRFRMVYGRLIAPGWGKPPATPIASQIRKMEIGKKPPSITPQLRRALYADLRRKQVQMVILGPGPGHRALVQFFTDLLRVPPESTGGVEIWWPGSFDVAKL